MMKAARVNGVSGVGLGLRSPHIKQVLESEPDVQWFEVHTCNYLGGGLNRALLHQINERYPLSFHGVNLNLGGVDDLDENYLTRLKKIIDEFNPALVSEHLCFSAYQGHHYHDLLPVPYTEEAVKHFAARIDRVQTYLERPIMVENVSQYYEYEESTLSEADFISAVCKEANCGIVLDLNNAFVNENNLGIPVEQLLDGIPFDRVGEIHLAGHSIIDGKMVDTHGEPICEDVWEIYRNVVQLYPSIPCLIEWDTNLPDWSELMLERKKAMDILAHARNDSAQFTALNVATKSNYKVNTNRVRF